LQLLDQAVRNGFLDDQFMTLMQLQDESNPDFVSEVISLYLEDSGSKLDRLAGCLGTPAPNFNEFDQIVHQFKGSSASFGAATMSGICVKMREAGHAQDAAACRSLLQELQASLAALQSRLEQFSILESRRKQCLNVGAQ